MRDVRNEVGFLDETMEGLSAVGRTMTFAVTTPLVALGSYAAQAAVEFDSSMRNINSILQLSEGEFQNLSSAILDFGTSMRSGPMGAAEAMYTIVGAGITDVGVALDFMNVANKTAEAGLADVERTTSTLIASFLSFGGAALTGADALNMLERQSDVLTQTVAVGVGSMDAFATSFAGVVPTVTMLNGSFEDTGGLLAYFTQRGLSAATAGVSLNAALTALIKPTDAMKAAFVGLGVASGEELVEKFGGLEEALIAVIETTGGSSEALGELFANVRAQRAVGILSQDLEGAALAIDNFTLGLEGATDRAHQQQMESFAARFDLMKAAVEGAAISIGNQLLPNLLPLVDGVTDIANSFSQVNPELIGFGLAIAAAVAATGPLLWLLSSMLNPLAALITVTGGIAAAWATDFMGMRETVEGALNDIFGDTSELGSIVDEITAALFPADSESTIVAAIPRIEIEPTEIITIKEGDNLWDIWFSGYRDQFSTFDAFKDAIGWDGMTIQPGDVFTLSGGFREGLLGVFDRVRISTAEIMNRIIDRTNTAMAGSQSPLEIGFGSSMPIANTLEDDLYTRIEIAVNNVGDRIGPIFETLIDRARFFFDDRIGAGLLWFSQLFKPTGAGGGKTPLSLAFEELLDGDLTSAINTVVPGLGDNLSTAIGGIKIDFPALFPKISSALGMVFKNVSSWVLSDGLPTLARMAGTIGGHLATSLYDAIAMAVNFITSPAIGQVGSEVAAYGEGLMGNMVDGFNAALDGTALQTDGIPAIQNFFDQLVDLGDTLEFDTLVEKVGELATSIGTFFSTVATADFSGLARIVGGLIAIGNVTLGGFYSIAAQVLPVAGEVIRDFLNTLSDALDGNGLDIPARLDAIGESINNFLSATGPSKVALDAITVTPSGFNLDVSRGFDRGQLESALHALDAAAAQALYIYFQENPLTAGISDLTITKLSEGALIPDGFDGEVIELFGVQYLIDTNTATYDLPTTFTPITDVVVPVETVTFDFTRDRAQYEGMSGAGASSIAEQLLPTGSVQQQFQTEMDAATAAMGSALATAMAEGGVTDPAIVTNDFLIPVQNAFQQYLGENSGTVGAIRSFASAALVSTAQAMLSFTTLGVTTGINMATVTSAITSRSPLIRFELGVIKGAVDNLKGAFDALAGAATAALNAAAAAMGMSLIYGGALAGGGPVTGGQTYLVGENGPELFTPPGNGNIISNSALTSGGGGGGGGNVNNYYTTINEVADLDALEREARRRGVSLFGRN